MHNTYPTCTAKTHGFSQQRNIRGKERERSPQTRLKRKYYGLWQVSVIMRWRTINGYLCCFTVKVWMQETFEIFLSKVETEFFTLIRKIDDNLTDITWSRDCPSAVLQCNQSATTRGGSLMSCKFRLHFKLMASALSEWQKTEPQLHEHSFIIMCVYVRLITIFIFSKIFFRTFDIYITHTYENHLALKY